MSAPRLVIAGGGPVGLALACAAQGYDCTVLEAAPAAPPPQALDLRVYAVSPGSRAFLRDLGAWELLDAARVAPVRRMEVEGDRGGRIAFGGRPGSALAWIVEANRLAGACEAQAATQAGIVVRHGARGRAFGASDTGSWVELADGERVAGDLLVGADGADSPTRSALGIASTEDPYGETAVVAHFDCEKPHGDTARQWFRKDGVLAWLPLPGRRISIVWSAPHAVAESLAALEPEALARRVRDAGGARLGDMALISSVGRFPLRLVRVPEPVVPGAVLVGDAAHAVHPLAGQGVNLGLQDAKLLAEVLAGRTRLERPGDLRVLRRYARGRKEDVTAMQFVTDSLDRLFASEAPGAAWVRNAGLHAVGSQPWAREALAARAMR